MKGIIPCGGRGTRLQPLTHALPKSILPIHNLPMILYPIKTLIAAGVTDIVLVANTDHFAHFTKLLGNGRKFGCNLTYVIQEEPLGIAHAINECRHICEGHDVAVILGDNLFFDNFEDSVKNFKTGSLIHTVEVNDPQRFGVAEFDNEMNVLSLEEKPSEPKSNHAITGFYLFDYTVFDKIHTLEPSARGEYEVTDILKAYLKEKSLRASKLQHIWADTGTIASLNDASQTVNEYLKENNINFLYEKSRLIRPSSV